MKKYLFLYIAVLISSSLKVAAQIRIDKPSSQKEMQMPFPDKLVTPASAKLIPAHIPDIKKPFVVSSDIAVNYVRDFINKVQAQCPSRKSPAPTLTLNAERANDFTANLQWETKYAFKASGFNIERSLDDTFHFAQVNFAWAIAGNGSKKNYHLPDHNDYSGISFYRIKQRDNDTTYRYSNIALVKGYDAVPFRIYPNPAANRIWIEINTKLNGNAVVMLYDASGKIMQQQILNCTKGILSLKSIEISNFATGVYQVKIIMPDKTFLAGKFVKK